MSYIMVLNEDVQGDPPDGTDMEKYAASTGVTTPVLADATNQVFAATPWNGAARPGKCVLSPDMVMLTCWVGTDDTVGFDAIEAHAGL